MNTLVMVRQPSAIVRWMRDTAASVGNFVGGLLAGAQACSTYTDLAGLSNAALAHRGLTRAELPRHAARKAGLINA